MNKHLLATALAILIVVQYGFSRDDFSALNSMISPTGSGTCTPLVTCPPDVTVTQIQMYDLSVAYGPRVKLADPMNCEYPELSYQDMEVYNDDCNIRLERSWVITSAATGSGSSGFAFCKQLLYVTPDCELLCPADACVSLNDNSTPDDLGYAYSSGSCAITSLDYVDVEAFECDGASLVTRRWAASFAGYDKCEFTCAQLITVNDNTGPELFNCPGNIVVDNSCSLVHWEEPKVVDNCARTTLTSTYRPGLSFSHGNHEVVYTAMDQCGNSNSCSFLVTVLDPDIASCQEDLVVAADENGTAVVTWTPPVYDGTCSDCPAPEILSGFKFIGTQNGSNYYVSRSLATWPEALEYSSKRHLELVKIESEEENAYLASLVRGHSLFIGLSDHMSEGNFRWSDGSALGYTNWFTAQPNNLDNNQDYVEILKTGEWNDVNNDTRNCFVIEVPCDFVQQVEGPRPGSELAPGTYSVSYEIKDGCGLSTCCSFDIEVLHSGEESSNSIVNDIEVLHSEGESSNKIINGIKYNLNDLDVVKSDIQKDNIKIFPNPTSDHVTIQGLVGKEIHSATLVNSLNQAILNIDVLGSGDKNIDVSNFEGGLYYLVVNYKSGQNQTKRLIKL